jgi:hypothetical protein
LFTFLYPYFLDGMAQLLSFLGTIMAHREQATAFGGCDADPLRLPIVAHLPVLPFLPDIILFRRLIFLSPPSLPLLSSFDLLQRRVDAPEEDVKCAMCTGEWYVFQQRTGPSSLLSLSPSPLPPSPRGPSVPHSCFAHIIQKSSANIGDARHLCLPLDLALGDGSRLGRRWPRS